MVGPTEVAGAYTALKAVKEIFSSLIDAKVDGDVKSKIIEAQRSIGEVQDALFQLREKNFELQEKVSELSRKLSEEETWSATLGQYELVTTSGGATVYRSKSSPQHYSCPACATSRKMAILQNLNSYSGKYACPLCKVEYPVDPRRNPPRVTMERM